MPELEVVDYRNKI